MMNEITKKYNFNDKEKRHHRKTQKQMTKQEQQKLNRERKQEKIKRAEEEGVIDKATRILSAMYLLHSQSAVMYDDLDELLERHGLKLGNIKGLGIKLNKVFDDYFKGFSKLVSREQTQNWADDLTKFDELFREFAKLKEEVANETS